MYPINVQTAEPIGPKFHVGHHITPGKVYERAKFQKLASNKIRFSLNLIIHEAFFEKKNHELFSFLQCTINIWYYLDKIMF